jgi:hypothetical protein
MGIHGDDVVREIREAFEKSGNLWCGDVHLHPKPDETDGWRYRDGKLAFDAVGRDMFRGFRITVEVIPVDDADWPSESDDPAEQWVKEE